MKLFDRDSWISRSSLVLQIIRSGPVACMGDDISCDLQLPVFYFIHSMGGM